MTRLEKLGRSTSSVEVLNISAQGIWLYVHGKEYFLSFEHHPWFKEANIGAIQNVKLLHGHHLHWPVLDVDLELESLESSHMYPLVYR